MFSLVAVFYIKIEVCIAYHLKTVTMLATLNFVFNVSGKFIFSVPQIENNLILT